MATPLQFAKRMNQIAVNIEREAPRAVQRAVRAIGASLVDETPVEDGDARSNWRALVGSAPTGIVGSRAPSATKADISGAVSKLAPDETVFVSNNLPYIVALVIFGTSRQAPAGFHKIAIEKGRKAAKTVMLLGRRR